MWISSVSLVVGVCDPLRAWHITATLDEAITITTRAIVPNEPTRL
jgi:hypothetical protein